MSLEIKLYQDAQAVAQAAAESLVAHLAKLLEAQDAAHIVVTGGTVGILTLEKLSTVESYLVDWNRVHIWWGDERFVPSDSPDRNAVQATAAWLGAAEIPAANIHEFPSSDHDLALNEAAIRFDQLLQQFADSGDLAPKFDVLLLGMGPDGHIASLFPGKPEIASGVRTVAEHDSPKPPPARLSFSYELINTAKEVWFTIAGADKAEAVSVAFSADKLSLPVGRVCGTHKTVWYLDNSAASKIG